MAKLDTPRGPLTATWSPHANATGSSPNTNTLEREAGEHMGETGAHKTRRGFSMPTPHASEQPRPARR